MTQGRPDRFHVLDSLRGICAIAVAFAHFITNSHLSELRLVQNSWLFVDFFFVLSGFVIAANYGDRFAGQRISFGRFAWRRLMRLYPLHLFMLVLFILTEFAFSMLQPEGAFEGAYAPELIWENVLLLQSFGVSGFLNWNYPSWSISAEFYTYLAFALTAMLGGLGRPLFWGIGLLVIPLGLILFHGGSLDITFTGGIWRCLYGFAFGTLIWALHLRMPPMGRIWGMLETPVLALVVVFVIYAPDWGVTLAAPLIFGLVVRVFSAEQGLWSRLFLCQPFRLFGLLSYSIYMVHAYVYARFINAAVLGRDMLGLPLTDPTRPEFPYWGTTQLWGDIMVLIMLSATICFAYITYFLIERPGMRLGHIGATQPKELSRKPAG